MSEVAMRIIEKHEQPVIKRNMGRESPKGIYLDTRNGRYKHRSGSATVSPSPSECLIHQRKPPTYGSVSWMATIGS